MKMKILIYNMVLTLGLVGTVASWADCDCNLRIYNDCENDISVNIVSIDNEYEYQCECDANSACWEDSGGVCCAVYNVFADEVLIHKNGNPLGKMEYMGNPLNLTGNVGVYYPQNFMEKN